jgi:transcriptional regulator with XRE-family HTH domain
MFSEMKTKEREQARQMRREQGWSVREIARLLGVSRSSVSLWVREIPLTAAQRAALEARNPLYNGQLQGARANAERGRARRLAYQQRGRRLARNADALYVGGCMLYWAEGDKARHRVRLANSDPAVLHHFVAFLRTHFHVEDTRIRITCNLFADHEPRQREIEDFWLGTLGLQRSALCKSIINRYSRYSQKNRKNKLPYGTCRVAVNSTEIAQTIYGSIQELAAFDRPEWVDMPA